MEHQQWAEIKWAKEPTKEQLKKEGQVETVAKFGGGGNKRSSANVLGVKQANECDPELQGNLPKVNKALKDAIRDARRTKGEKGWTQDELDRHAGLPANTTKGYENGTAIPNPAQLNKLERALGVKLPRPSKPKAPKPAAVSGARAGEGKPGGAINRGTGRNPQPGSGLLMRRRA